jgi:hypothetical protein
VVRHRAGAVSGLLVWSLVVEALVVQFALAEVVRFVPFDTDQPRGRDRATGNARGVEGRTVIGGPVPEWCDW